ncbi:metal-dependent hydrolase [compost metagenome]
MKSEVQIRLLRHATLTIEIANTKFLVDPLFAEKDAYDPIPYAGNTIRYPMVGLPFNGEETKQLINEVDAILVTHTHNDHWDIVAQNIIPKDKPLLCQPADLDLLKQQGFQNVTAVIDELTFNGISITRTGGQHGTGEIGKKMGIVSGFVLNDGTTNVYVAGDTIWCEEVEEALNAFKPDITIVNAGAPQYIVGDPITMTPNDIISVAEHLPSTKIVAVHMDTVSHAKVSRLDLEKELKSKNYLNKVLIPADGEMMLFN